MRITENEMSLLIQIIFEWDRWITMDGMESDMDKEDMEQIRKLFRKLYGQYWYEQETA